MVKQKKTSPFIADSYSMEAGVPCSPVRGQSLNGNSSVQWGCQPFLEENPITLSTSMKSIVSAPANSQPQLLYKLTPITAYSVKHNTIQVKYQFCKKGSFFYILIATWHERINSVLLPVLTRTITKTS